MQSISAYEIAKKDLGQVVTQAQKELGKLTEPDQSKSSQPGTVTESGADVSADGNAGSITPEAPSSPSQTGPPASRVANQLFTRFQSSLPPNLSERLHKTVQDAQSSVLASQVRSTINSGVSRLQEQTRGMSLAQAEEFIQQHSETLLKDTTEFFKEAVKVIPPEGSSAATGGTIWDGSDSWVGTVDITDDSLAEASNLGDGERSAEARLTRRAEVLLHRLRNESEILLSETVSEARPNDNNAVNERLSTMGDPNQGFISEAWKDRREAALTAEGGALSRMFSDLGLSSVTAVNHP